MEYTTYASRLRFLGAHDVDDAVVDYDGLTVRGPDGEKIGGVEGFIVDAQAARVYYLVVDSGGWFRSRRFLLPIGHAALDADRTSLHVDVAKDAISRYPEFDPDRFRQFSDDDLRTFESRLGEACCPGEPRDTPAPSWSYDTHRHYTQPGWWTGEKPRAAAIGSTPVRPRQDSGLVAAGAGSRGGEHPGARPQPGQVLGLEPGGERGYIGDFAEDERERRRLAERAREDSEPRQSDR